MDMSEPQVLSDPSEAEKRRKGINSEWKFFRAFRESKKDWPVWLKKVRWATEQEDQKGIDFVAETRDVGGIYVQIKSSPASAVDFLRKARKGHFDVVIIVVLEKYLGMEIFSSAKGLLSDSRELKLKNLPHVLLLSPCAFKYAPRRP